MRVRAVGGLPLTVAVAGLTFPVAVAFDVTFDQLLHRLAVRLDLIEADGAVDRDDEDADAGHWRLLRLARCGAVDGFR